MPLSPENLGRLTEADEHIAEAQKLLKELGVGASFDRVSKTVVDKIVLPVMQRKHGNLGHLRDDLKAFPEQVKQAEAREAEGS